MTLLMGAVAYDPKVVTIWEGMRRYFHEEARLPVEVVLFQSYEAQVSALLAAPGDPLPRIDIGWNTNLAYLQADAWSEHHCRPIAMRDTDVGWATKIVAATGGQVGGLADLKNRTVAAATADMPRFFRSTSWSAKAWSRGAITAPSASTATLASMATPERARPKSFARFSMAAPRPARSAARSGRRCRASAWFPKARCGRFGRHRPTITACSPRGPISRRR